MKTSNVTENRVLLTILLIFILSFGLFIYISYSDQKREIEIFKKSLQDSIDSLYIRIVKQRFTYELSMRAKFILNRYDRAKKLKAIESRDRESLKELFQTHFYNLKEQIEGFNVMHIHSAKGESIYRFHREQMFGDDLTKFRVCVDSLVKNPRVESFFEMGIQGLAFRHITPIYKDNGELIAFFELGVKPSKIIDALEDIFDVKAYFIIEDEYLLSNSDKSLSHDGYTVCKSCLKDGNFISKNFSKINFEKLDNSIISDSVDSYSMIAKPLYDALNNEIGKILIFQNITIFKNQIDNLIFKYTLLFLLTALSVGLILYGYIRGVFKSLNRARFLLDNTNDAVYVISIKDSKVLDVNDRASLMLGYSKDELLRKRFTDFREPLENSKEFDWDRHIKELRLKHFIISRGIHIRKNRSKFPIEASLSYIASEDGDYMIAIARDISTQLELEKKIQNRANELERLQSVISKSVLYSTSDLDGNITFVSKAFEKLTGYSKDELIGKNHSIFKSGETSKEFYQSMWRKLSKDKQFIGEIKNYTKDREVYWIKLTIDPIFDEEGRKIGYSSYREDITDKKELEYISSHDNLTTLYNRSKFSSKLSEKLKSASRYGHKFGFIIMDIDYFKKINDTFGHQIGDETLKRVAKVLKLNIREDDFVARWGGEEFVIIANGAELKDLKGLVSKLQKEILKASFNPVEELTLSFGLTIYRDGDSSESILKRADKALYLAKESGRDRYNTVL